jgi:D-alanyl-D-alanine dipeptidase
MKNLIEINEQNFDVFLEIRYASKLNVCNIEMYKKPICFLHKDLIPNFKQAIKLAKKLGYKIKIWDAFRPIEVQKFMFDKFPTSENQEGFISNPENGAIPHCRGVALDITLCDLKGNEIEMGTDFDEFSELAFNNCNKISKEAQKNRIILLGIMTSSGFDFFSKEWWHFQAFNPRNFGIIQSPKEFINI